MSLHATVALNRFGLGTRPGEMARVASDPKGWLLGQLVTETVLPAPLAALPPTLDDLTAFGKWTAELARKARSQGMDPATMAPGKEAAAGLQQPDAGATGSMGNSMQSLSVEVEFRRTFAPRHARALKARFDVAVATEQPFFERLVHFWSNHFVVSGAKPGATAMPPSFERDVIRPRVMGRFADLLLASTRHPAMLFYLDNVQSIGGDSELARDPGLRKPGAAQDFAIPRSRGLNENLAREILELHTLGARSGYQQADVTSFAKVITGWTVARPPRVPYFTLVRQGRLNGAGMFDFDPQAHEPGAQTVLGRVYPQDGVAQGEAVLATLAEHPATARFIATKLARHFVADTPPDAVVERLARVFLQSGGELSRVYAALVDSPQAYAQALQKFKTPQEYLVSAARGLPGLQFDGATLQRTLAGLGQVPYNPPGPNGWPDLEGEWLGADALWKRMVWANEVAQSLSPPLPPAQLGPALLGSALSTATQQAVERAESPAQALTLLLASAEFQRR